jgi:all-trans-8'-apo-beta-carotenal 15,15'-oxygenase
MSFAALRQNLRRAHGFEPLELEGKLPDDLRGTLFRVGPGLFERFGVRVAHPFEADGAMLAVRFGSNAEGAVRVVESAGYLAEQAARRRLFGTGAGWLRNLKANFRGRGKNTANTSAWLHEGQLYALMEGGRPTKIAPDSLATLGEEDFDGVLRSTFSAHPHRVAALQTSFNFGVRYGREHFLDVYAIPDHGSVSRLTSVAMPWPAMVHDFIATPTHLVFMVCPVRIAILRALLGVANFERLLKWEPERGTELLIVPLAEPEAVVRIETEPFWVWHFVNGFDDGGDLVVDLCRHPNFGTLAAIRTGRDQSAEHRPPLYHRARIDVRGKRMTSEARHESPAEFPRVHPQVEGAPHHFAYLHGTHEAKGAEGSGTAPESEDARDCIRVLEVETGRASQWLPERPTALSEPVPVARADRPGDERGVWLLTVGLDDERERSFIAVLDAADVERGPVAKAWFDQPLPLGFHGAFDPAA